jgi:ribosomal protein S18 acetylase RimI-like enzyme
MTEVRVHVRRGRRTDFTAVMRLLANAAIAVPPPDRATLRRFRNLVADLGADFYTASVDGELVGLVHVTYARQLTRPPRATLDWLLVDRACRRRGVGSALLAFVRQRARQRGCDTLGCSVPPDNTSVRAFLEKAGWQRSGDRFVESLVAEC